MDEQTKQYLKDILNKSPEALTDADKAFLRARQTYIGKKEQAKFPNVFEEQPEEKVEKKKSTKQTEVMEKLEEKADPMAHPGVVIDPTEDDDDPTDIV